MLQLKAQMDWYQSGFLNTTLWVHIVIRRMVNISYTFGSVMEEVHIVSYSILCPTHLVAVISTTLFNNSRMSCNVIDEQWLLLECPLFTMFFDIPNTYLTTPWSHGTANPFTGQVHCFCFVFFPFLMYSFWFQYPIHVSIIGINMSVTSFVGSIPVYIYANYCVPVRWLNEHIAVKYEPRSFFFLDVLFLNIHHTIFTCHIYIFQMYLNWFVMCHLMWIFSLCQDNHGKIGHTFIRPTIVCWYGTPFHFLTCSKHQSKDNLVSRELSSLCLYRMRY